MGVEDYLEVFQTRSSLRGFGATPSSASSTTIAPTIRAAQSIIQAGQDAAQWNLDARWRPSATLYWAARCVRQTRFDSPIVDDGPYRVGGCGHYIDGSRVSPTCDWSVWLLRCDAAAGEYAFQGKRYVWAQEKLRQALASKPERYSPDFAQQWADWAWNVARLLSVARWATNIRTPYFQPPQPNYMAWKAEMDRTRPAPPAGMHAGYVTSILAIKNWDNAAAETPTTAASFDPIRTTQNLNSADTRYYASLQAFSPFAPHPWQIIGRRLPQLVTNSLGRRVSVDGTYGNEWPDPKQTFVRWCQATLGIGNWIGWPDGIQAVVRTASGTTLGDRVYPAYGAADSTMRMLESNALDVIALDYGVAVKGGVDRWAEAMASFPLSSVEQFRLARAVSAFDLDVQRLATAGAAVTAGNIEARYAEVTGQVDSALALLGTVASLVNPVAGIAAGVAALLIRGVTELAQSIGTARGDIPCPPPAFIRAFSDSKCAAGQLPADLPGSPPSSPPPSPVPPGSPPPPSTTPPTAAGGGFIPLGILAYVAYRLMSG